MNHEVRIPHQRLARRRVGHPRRRRTLARVDPLGPIGRAPRPQPCRRPPQTHSTADVPQRRWTLSGVEPGVSFNWRSRRLGADATGRHAVNDNDDGSTTAVLALSQTGLIGTLVALVSRRITKRYVALEAAGLKERSEHLGTRSL